MELTDIQKRALKLYRAPFRYDSRGGYIWDSRGEMVADNHTKEAEQPAVDWMSGAMACLRIRGWGRIKYMENPPELQDAVGELIARALTEFWQQPRPEHSDYCKSEEPGCTGGCW